MQTKGTSVQSSLLDPQAWARRVVGSLRDQLAPPRVPTAMQREVCAALDETAAEARGFGDCFVFGRCSPAHELALAGALEQLGHGDARTFWCADGAQQTRGFNTGAPSSRYIPVGSLELEARALAALRQRHRVRAVSVVMVADDFPWSLGRVVHGLVGLLASRAALLVAGQQAALLETLWYEELRRGQHGFEVSRLGAPASSWARFRLQRRHQV